MPDMIDNSCIENIEYPTKIECSIEKALDILGGRASFAPIITSPLYVPALSKYKNADFDPPVNDSYIIIRENE